MNRSESIGSLAKALSAAQADYKPLPKTTKGHNYFYAKLDAYHESIQPVFSKHGLSYIQTIETGDQAVRAVTLIMHESGEWLEGDGPWVPWTIKNNAAQDVGSATTYAKRYSLSAVAGIESEDDDGAMQSVPEGQTAPAPRPQKARQAKSKPTPAPKPTVTVASLNASLRAAKTADALAAVGEAIGEFVANEANANFRDELRASYKARKDEIAPSEVAA